MTASPHIRRLVAGLAAAAALAVPATALATATGGGLGVRLLDAPANLVNDPRAHSYVIDSVNPGAVFARHVLVTNDTGARAHILLYAAPATIADGAFSVGPRGGANRLTSWMTVSPAAVDLPNGAAATVTATFRVPAGTRAGERYAAIVADLPPTAGPVPGAGVLIESRAAIRVYLDVAGSGGAPAAAFTVTSLTAGQHTDGTPFVSVLVRNTGGRAIDLAGSLSLSHGPGGLSAGPFPLVAGTTLAPGQTEPATVNLSATLPDGPWLATATVRSGLTAERAQGTITFPTTPGTTARPVPARAIPFARNKRDLVPIAVGLLLLLLALLLTVLWRARRARHAAGGPGPAAGTPVPPQRAPAPGSLARQR
ncbi:MAG TPA: hypothetical protein VNG13_04900 [Mycobacteriales bacterium]|nr:hypothetical protein [Mycobacteriales bacterium]